jgi:hypothetical protein
LPVYTYVTKAQAIAQLSARLYDATNQFWSVDELALYLNEALRTWNAHTGYWRDNFTFDTVADQVWYDIADGIDMPNTLRPYTVTDDELYRIIQFQILEPSVGVNPWTGVSTQFTTDQLVNAVQRRRDELFSISGCTITRSTVGAVAGRIQLPDSVIDVRRMAYLPAAIFAKSNSVMWPDDTWAEMSFDPTFTLNPAGTPYAYIMTTQPPLAFDTDRPPAYAGQYELLTVNAGAALDPTTPSLLNIPDDWTHVLKWGALADLMARESNARDSMRATYCEQRYRMGLALMLRAPALLAARLGSVAIQIDSVRGADIYKTDWPADASGTPGLIFHMGLNKIALNPPADSTPRQFLLTVVENAPLPALVGDFLQVGRDDLESILDCAQHIAMFKCGGQEFTDTFPLFERFMKQCGLYNAKLQEIAEYTSAIMGLSKGIELDPRMTPAGEQVATTPPGGSSA